MKSKEEQQVIEFKISSSLSTTTNSSSSTTIHHLHPILVSCLVCVSPTFSAQMLACYFSAIASTYFTRRSLHSTNMVHIEAIKTIIIMNATLTVEILLLISRNECIKGKEIQPDLLHRHNRHIDNLSIKVVLHHSVETS